MPLAVAPEPDAAYYVRKSMDLGRADRWGKPFADLFDAIPTRLTESGIFGIMDALRSSQDALEDFRASLISRNTARAAYDLISIEATIDLLAGEAERGESLGCSDLIAESRRDLQAARALARYLMRAHGPRCLLALNRNSASLLRLFQFSLWRLTRVSSLLAATSRQIGIAFDAIARLWRFLLLCAQTSETVPAPACRSLTAQLLHCLSLSPCAPPSSALATA